MTEWELSDDDIALILMFARSAMIGAVRPEPEKTPLTRLVRLDWFDPDDNERKITYKFGGLAIDCRPGYEDAAVESLMRAVKAAETRS